MKPEAIEVDIKHKNRTPQQRYHVLDWDFLKTKITFLGKDITTHHSEKLYVIDYYY